MADWPFPVSWVLRGGLDDFCDEVIAHVDAVVADDFDGFVLEDYRISESRRLTKAAAMSGLSGFSLAAIAG
jgi:hypothetical protein